jgi:hypothetical protein
MIAGFEKHPLATVAALRDMVRQTRNDDAGKTGQRHLRDGITFFRSKESANSELAQAERKAPSGLFSRLPLFKLHASIFQATGRFNHDQST